MNIAQRYNALFEDAREKITLDQYHLDSLISSSSDQRRGVTLIARPSKTVVDQIQCFLKPLQALEPTQYYYPTSDIHITILSIISCYEGFALSQIQPSDYSNVIKEALKDQTSFQLDFTGITASPAGIMIQGFWQDDSLSRIRNRLRTAFATTALQQSLDERYVLQTAHATVMRFQSPLQRKEELLNYLLEHRTHVFGTTGVDTLELVSNDWYMKEKQLQTLDRFSLQ
ncbi:mutarotase [Siphonobacter sp. SORGH_AS_0500]|uniref:2'-5' RNA ligase family protein n=1 Tax=Siphonobacter sp. SORGH_AS_0500 TaxID=1864824 RepID=UPI0028619F9B|nr:mutarotase [Siphonobacter sp. SORGH_AS_0500]MDR6197129.1 2'-5' RNA ligase [Siphonobacter sp. SORGH_AS_0500]